MKRIIGYILFLLINISCTPEKKEIDSDYIQLNVSILLDLSDRIDPKNNDKQNDRDKKIIEKILRVVEENVKKKGTFNSMDKFRIMFYPKPDVDELSELATNLNFDLELLEPREKKLLFKNLKQQMNLNLDKLYSLASNSSSYLGSDLWYFFKDEISNKCIIDNKNYKNILIVLTDGYIYWKYTKQQNGNRFTFITGNSEQISRFRGKNDWEVEFDKGDFGLIKIPNDYSKLHVLVAEVNPEKEHPEDFDIIKKYLSKWFEEMNISADNLLILKTDVPTYTEPVIEKFMKQ